MLRIPEIEFEIPEKTQKGQINTLEGVLKEAAKNLALMQSERMEQTPEVGQKVAEVILALSSYYNGYDLPFTVVLEDVAGNSFIENPSAPSPDPALTTSWFDRSREQDESLGLQQHEEEPIDKALGVFRDDVGVGRLLERAVEKEEEEDGDEMNFTKSEAMILPSACHHCLAPGNMISCVVNIPHFRDVLIMAFNCDACGFRSSEVIQPLFLSFFILKFDVSTIQITVDQAWREYSNQGNENCFEGGVS